MAVRGPGKRLFKPKTEVGVVQAMMVQVEVLRDVQIQCMLCCPWDLVMGWIWQGRRVGGQAGLVLRPSS